MVVRKQLSFPLWKWEEYERMAHTHGFTSVGPWLISVLDYHLGPTTE